ncbi:hypothetical protein [Novosphingobium sp. 9U]|uniref:hypothetical protein n=1 Tax=Novosphingobium sp. 9U TaxID=2653158 RepID=UPI0013571BDC|nr:hypothetical protein [Novosphingobium sp. 9U]
MFSLGVVGIAAGAYLAFATVPSFAPYQDRRASAPVVLSQPIQGDRQNADLAAPAEERGNGVRLRPDFEQGTLVLELPRWAQETGSWFALGRRALQDWSGEVGPENGADGRSWNDRAPHGSQRKDDSEPGYSMPRPRYDDGGYGYRSHGQDEADDSYAPEGWSAAEQDWAERGSDAAADAADRAREVARDVHDALQDL